MSEAEEQMLRERKRENQRISMRKANILNSFDLEREKESENQHEREKESENQHERERESEN